MHRIEKRSRHTAAASRRIGKSTSKKPKFTDRVSKLKSAKARSPIIKPHDQRYYKEKAIAFAAGKLTTTDHYCVMNGVPVRHVTTKLCCRPRVVLDKEFNTNPEPPTVVADQYGIEQEHIVVSKVARELYNYRDSEHHVLIGEIFHRYESVFRHLGATNEKDVELLRMANAEIRLFEAAYKELVEYQCKHVATYNLVVDLLENAWLKHHQAMGDLEATCVSMMGLQIRRGNLEGLADVMEKMALGWEAKIKRSEGRFAKDIAKARQLAVGL